VAISPQQDPGRGPMRADLPDQPANMGRALSPLGPARRAQQGSDEPPVAVKDNDGLKAVFVVVGIEQSQLLMTIDGIECIVDIKHDLPRRFGKGVAVDPDHLMPHPDERAHVGQVFHPRNRWLGT